jgi:hypothetical protein
LHFPSAKQFTNREGLLSTFFYCKQQFYSKQNDEVLILRCEAEDRGIEPLAAAAGARARFGQPPALLEPESAL